MTSSILFAVFSWFHIISAMGWFGSLVFITMVLMPSVSKLSAESRQEIMAGILPRASMVIRGFGGLAIIFGIIFAAYLSMTGTSFSMSSAYGISLATGAIIALIAFGAFGEGMFMPAARRYASAVKEGKQNGADIQSLERKISRSAFLQIILLGIVIAAMVTAGAL